MQRLALVVLTTAGVCFLLALSAYKHGYNSGINSVACGEPGVDITSHLQALATIEELETRRWLDCRTETEPLREKIKILEEWIDSRPIK